MGKIFELAEKCNANIRRFQEKQKAKALISSKNATIRRLRRQLAAAHALNPQV